MGWIATSGGQPPTPSPTPDLSFDTWLDPAFPWRTGVIIFAAIVAMSIVVLVARHRERRRH